MPCSSLAAFWMTSSLPRRSISIEPPGARPGAFRSLSRIVTYPLSPTRTWCPKGLLSVRDLRIGLCNRVAFVVARVPNARSAIATSSARPIRTESRSSRNELHARRARRKRGPDLDLSTEALLPGSHLAALTNSGALSVGSSNLPNVDAIVSISTTLEAANPQDRGNPHTSDSSVSIRTERHGRLRVARASEQRAMRADVGEWIVVRFKEKSVGFVRARTSEGSRSELITTARARPRRE